MPGVHAATSAKECRFWERLGFAVIPPAGAPAPPPNAWHVRYLQTTAANGAKRWSTFYTAGEAHDSATCRYCAAWRA